MLTRLYCDNYKCLVNFELRTQPIQLLMGLNGAGKSTVFEVLELLRDFAARGEVCDDRLVGKTLTRWQRAIGPQTFELDVVGPAGAYRYELVVDEWGQPANLRVRRESVTLNGRPLFLFEDGILHHHNDQSQDLVQFPFNPRRSGLAVVDAHKYNERLNWFKEWLGRLACVQVDPKRMSARAEKEAVYPAPDLANFAEWYRNLRLSEGAATDALRASLQEVLAGFESLDLKEAGLGTRVLQVTARSGTDAKAKPQPYDFDELSDGQRALIGLYALLHCALIRPALLCIDEPDNFVALAEIQPWLSRLCDRAQETGSQLLVASHHPELLNQLATRHGVILDRPDAGPTRVRPFAPPADTTLTPAEVVARGWERA